MVTKSAGLRPKKGRLGKKKRKLIEAHTLSHLRGAHDYSHSHTRVREIDARVAGAGVLGARIRAPRHHGVTVRAVPVVPTPAAAARHGRQMPLRPPTRRSLTIMGPRGKEGEKGDKGDSGRNGIRGKKGRDGKEGRGGRNGRNGADGAAGATGARGGIGATGPQGERGLSGMQGLTGGHGPRGPAGKNGKDGARGLQGKKGIRGEVGFRGPAGRRGAEGYAGLNGLVGPIGPQGPMGLSGMRGPMLPVEFKATGRGADTDMVVRGADVYKRQAAPHAYVPKAKTAQPSPAARPQAPPFAARQVPKPAKDNPFKAKAEPFKGGGFHEGAAGPAPHPKQRRNEKPEEKQRRREDFKRPGKAPRREATAAEEAAHDQKNIDAAVSNNRKTSEKRKELAQRNRDRKAAREAKLNESRASKMPSASSNIPDPGAAGPSNHSEHAHHHTGHRRMHDDNFSTGL